MLPKENALMQKITGLRDCTMPEEDIDPHHSDLGKHEVEQDFSSPIPDYMCISLC